MAHYGSGGLRRPAPVNILRTTLPARLQAHLPHLSRAIELAEQGRGCVSPNPLVGAVVVRDGKVLGEGYHAAYGEPHAEREALAACTGDARGGTLYVSLEPCCHHGRTPPCTDAILEAGIARVVVASDDPTEKASGRGLGILRDEGVDVVVVADGEPAVRARLLNQAFRKHARTGRPHVLFKSAMTLDGKVATRTGDSKWISGEESRLLSHHWRAERDAVVVGIGTALADDPQLTARIGGVTRQPRRVVFDSEARTPVDSQLVQMAPEIPLTVVVSRAAPRAATTRWRWRAPRSSSPPARTSPPACVPRSTSSAPRTSPRSCSMGGPKLAGAFLDAGEVDEVRLFLAPVLLGARTARDPIEGEGVERIDDALRALTLDCERIGEDVLVSARLREW
jgi:diaminohydroxyphosphoribosylaminopyrimidine deaminase/5-amino-6-(5-phosphoribosylamino)uracil reductase